MSTVEQQVDEMVSHAVARDQKKREAVGKPIPFTPLYWRVLVQIDEPDEITPGGLHLVRDTTETEKFLTYVGRIVAIGDLAFKAETRAKLKMSDGKCPGIGEYVVFYKNAGSRFKTPDGRMFVLLSDSEIWGVTEDPEGVDCLAM